MVQIILNIISINRYSCLKLYIPHGSDNTKENLHGKLIKKYLYIPHGSDNTMWKARIMR